MFGGNKHEKFFLLFIFDSTGNHASRYRKFLVLVNLQYKATHSHTHALTCTGEG